MILRSPGRAPCSLEGGAASSLPVANVATAVLKPGSWRGPIPGQVLVPAAPALQLNLLGQEGRYVLPHSQLSPLDQEGQDVLPHGSEHMLALGQEGQESKSPGAATGEALFSPLAGAAHAAAALPGQSGASVDGLFGQEGMNMKLSGVLGAITDAVAAHMANNATDKSKPAVFTFNAPKIAVQGASKHTWTRVEREGDKEVQFGNKNMWAGNKRSALNDVRPTGSDVVFSFENASADSVEFMLYNDVSVSCKRVCMGRVETVRGVDGVITHVSKEVEEKEEEYVEQRRESIGEEKEVENVSAASDPEDHQEK